jgi:hypothetical protein
LFIETPFRGWSIMPGDQVAVLPVLLDKSCTTPPSPFTVAFCG